MKKLIITLFSIFSVGLFVIAQSASTFINEVNYLASNPQQGIEIAGQAGQDLEGWSVVMYTVNGTVDYVEYLNNGLIPNQQNGYGAIWYDVEQGSNSGGIALVNPNGAVVQFISYGTLGFLNTIIQAVEGPAQGMTSEYIGTQLLPSVSLELIGLGISYLDFIWAIPSGSTPGTVNTNQEFGSPASLMAPVSTITPAISQNNQLEVNIEVYPNPTTDLIRVSTQGATQQAQNTLELFDATGKILRQVNLGDESRNNFEIDLSSLNFGTYFVKFSNGSNQVTKLIVKN